MVIFIMKKDRPHGTALNLLNKLEKFFNYNAATCLVKLDFKLEALLA